MFDRLLCQLTREMADLKEEILSKIDKKFNELKLDFLTELKYHVKKRIYWSYENWNQKTWRTGINSTPAAGPCEEVWEASECIEM